MKSTALLTIVLAIGCASAPSWQAAGTEWVRDGATEEQFSRDKAECEGRSAPAKSPAEGSLSESQMGDIRVGRESIAQCLRDRGWEPWGGQNAYDRARDTFPGR